MLLGSSDFTGALKVEYLQPCLKFASIFLFWVPIKALCGTKKNSSSLISLRNHVAIPLVLFYGAFLLLVVFLVLSFVEAR